MNPTQILRFTIDEHEVLCHQTGQGRLWHCQCDYFHRMLAKHQEGFCPHIALAIEDAIAAGVIHSRQSDAQGALARIHYGSLPINPKST